MLKQTRPTQKQRFTLFDTPIGFCALAWSDRGITALQLPERSKKETRSRLADRWRTVALEESEPPPKIKKAIDELCLHLNGSNRDLSKLPVDYAGVPPFHCKVYEAARKIPSGATVSYGELARAAGSPLAARAVGQALAKNPIAIVVPCHRVLGSNGSAGGFSAYGGCDIKQRLLNLEGAGIRFEDGKVVKSPAKKQPPVRRFVPRESKYEFEPEEAIEHICRKDKRMAKLIQQVGAFRMGQDEVMTPFETLAESIVYQQLTGKAAATIFSRVKDLYGGSLPEPKKILATSDEKLRSAGLSQAKTLALKDLARKQMDGAVPSLPQLNSMTNEEIIERLTAVRGIGRWTVEMLLMFKLGRADVLPVNDYGVRKGFARIYGRNDELPTPRELEEFGERWRPYRSVASWYLWRALEL